MEDYTALSKELKTFVDLKEYADAVDSIVFRPGGILSKPRVTLDDDYKSNKGISYSLMKDKENQFLTLLAGVNGETFKVRKRVVIQMIDDEIDSIKKRFLRTLKEV